ncbi:7-cyano-7-deazaguanine/7-aminomethyl-7-deazaguanine transporter [Vandammella animalimorsus]|uniref:7-cyano-7-deazaguanine/7-aminomethyl-7- deazaguanine transporter n=1 Tax=Vandammella animalimorsus TaxID=2029117 RepID=UPI0031B9E03B
MTAFADPSPRVSKALALLVALHIAIIIASNYLVQLPIDLLGFHSTWGAFSFPFIFLATDLTVRLIGKQPAQRVIARVMLPALLASYVVSVLFHEGRFNGLAALGEFNGFVFRIAVASFAAYVLGQLLDIQVFDRMRRSYKAWWLAPTASSILGQALDTAAFFSIAFWRSSDPFMAAHWGEIALVDYVIKLLVSLALFVPAYGLMLAAIVRRIKTPAPAAPACASAACRSAAP